MNIIFLRHGEATDNVEKLISDKEIYWSTLTKDGISKVKKSVKELPENIDKVYVSPFPRTMETAHYFNELYPRCEVVIENRIREIYKGKYTHQKNNEDLDETRIKQIDGDYFIRLGQYGENNYEIENRICEFLKDLHNNNFKNSTVMIVTHGGITSYIKRILNIKTSHISKGEFEIIENIDFKPLYKHIELLKKIKRDSIKEKIDMINNTKASTLLKNSLIKYVKKEFNNIELSEQVFNGYISGLNNQNLKQITNPKFEGNIILVCFYADFEEFAEKWMEHYINIGVKNFVLVNNNAHDITNNIIKKYLDRANISFWSLDENYDCNKMCGCKQKIFEHYGPGNIYINVDSDELLIYKDYKNTKIDEFIKKEKLTCAKTMMLDVYTNKNLYEGTLDDYKFVDKGTYKMTSSVPYGQRFFGGPRMRTFNITPSLQKIPFIKYTGKEILANCHYYYPYSINHKAKFCTYLLHYKFLPGDAKKYVAYANDGGHWNGSREYKIYSNNTVNNEKISFYNKNISILIDDIKFDF